jgi:hypothetical protein
MAVTPTVTVTGAGSMGEDGNDYYAYGTITVTGTYVTGGFSLAGLVSGLGIKLERLAYLRASGSGRLLEWNPSTQLLLVKAWATAGATVAASEITNGTDIGSTSDSYQFFAIGQ